jgi:nucleotidyltransferase/DNA polymerase involved in DNA repair
MSIGVARTKHLAKIASQVAKPDALVVVDPETELEFLHELPVSLMWGVGPATEARLARIGITTIGQLARELSSVRGALADHPNEKVISLLAISVSNLEALAIVQLELPLGLGDEGRRPGTKKGVARSRADRAIDVIRKRFGGQAVDYGSAVRTVRSVPDEFRRLAEKEL